MNADNAIIYKILIGKVSSNRNCQTSVVEYLYNISLWNIVKQKYEEEA